jgi:hypothetical protein
MTQASRSITPTTFKGVSSLSHNIALIRAEYSEVDALITMEQSKKTDYQATIAGSAAALKIATGQVTDQGKSMEAETKIDALAKLVAGEFDSRIERYTKYQEEFRKYLDFDQRYSGINLSIEEHYSYENKSGTTQNEVTRFGIDTSSLAVSIVAEFASICVPSTPTSSVKSGGSKGTAGSNSSRKPNGEQHMLHPLEVLNIRQALEACQTHIQKTVLIDIFARDEKTSVIKLEDNGAPKVHTVVLYLQQDRDRDQVLVIDPSNSEFSKHLAGNSDLIFLPHTRILPREVLVPPTQVKIYSPPSGVETGLKPHEPRNCTDIAVKLAFGLNKHAGNIDIKDLASLSAIQQVGNNESVNKSLFFEPIEAIARIRQASNDDLREGIDKVLTSMQRQIKAVEEYFKDSAKTDEFIDKNIGHFSTLCDPDKYKNLAEGLLRVYNENDDLFYKYMKETETVLEGECTGLFADL